jgi:hypothetical protein
LGKNRRCFAALSMTVRLGLIGVDDPKSGHGHPRFLVI